MYKTIIKQQQKTKRAQAIRFVNLAQQIIIKHGGILEPESPNTDATVYTIQAQSGPLLVTIYPPEDHLILYSVYMKFKNPNPTLGNPYSGKNNFLHFQHFGPENAAETFEAFLLESITYKHNATPSKLPRLVFNSPLIEYANFLDGTFVNIIRLKKPYLTGVRFAVYARTNYPHYGDGLFKTYQAAKIRFNLLIQNNMPITPLIKQAQTCNF